MNVCLGVMGGEGQGKSRLALKAFGISTLDCIINNNA